MTLHQHSPDRSANFVSDPYPEPISIEHDHPNLAVDERTLEQLVQHVLDKEGASPIYVGVVLSDHDTVRELNQTYLDHDYNTDVLSFSLQEDPQEDPETVEGEIYVDLDTADERYGEFDTSFEREACRYVTHGVLHLLGYEDATEEGQQTMRDRENEYLDQVLS